MSNKHLSYPDIYYTFIFKKEQTHFSFPLANFTPTVSSVLHIHLAPKRNYSLQTGSHQLQPFILYGSESHRVFKECCFAPGRISGLALSAMCRRVSAHKPREGESKLLAEASSHEAVREAWAGLGDLESSGPGWVTWGQSLNLSCLTLPPCKMISQVLTA